MRPYISIITFELLSPKHLSSKIYNRKQQKVTIATTIKGRLIEKILKTKTTAISNIDIVNNNNNIQKR